MIAALEAPQASGAPRTIAETLAAGNAGVARIPGKHGSGSALHPARRQGRRQPGRAGAAAHRDRRGGGQHGGPPARALARGAGRLRRDPVIPEAAARLAIGPRGPRVDAHRRGPSESQRRRSSSRSTAPPAAASRASSKAAARRLGFAFLDTGAAYRALTWFALENGIDLTDADAVLALLPEFSYADRSSTAAGMTVLVHGTDVSDAIREPRISAVVSDVARIPQVRIALNDAVPTAHRARPTATGSSSRAGTSRLSSPRTPRSASC